MELYEMELHELISEALEQIVKAQGYSANKKKYNVEEVNVEMNISKIKKDGGKIKFYIAEGGLENQVNNTQKISVKLKPKDIIKRARKNNE